MASHSERRVLVTGAGTGIGRGVALAFASAGARVALHYHRSTSGAESAVREIEAAGGTARAFRGDFRDVNAVRGVGRDAIAYLGGLDTLVNNAGISVNIPFDRVTPEQFDTVFDVNIRATYFLTQAVLPALEDGGGSVINLTSIHALEGVPEHTIYASTKGALVSFTRTLAIELAPRGVRVNAIAPGAVVVENWGDAMPNLDLEALGRAIPAGFVGEPRDVARVALFLASEDARYIIGQTLVVDGGTVSWMPFDDQFRHSTGRTVRSRIRAGHRARGR